jgi:hypothetical protein
MFSYININETYVSTVNVNHVPILTLSTTQTAPSTQSSSHYPTAQATSSDLSQPPLSSPRFQSPFQSTLIAV